MPLLKSDIYTTDYIYSLPEGKRAELIDGVIYDMAPPNRIHQKLISELQYKITDYIKKNITLEVRYEKKCFKQSWYPYIGGEFGAWERCFCSCRG